MTMPGTYGIIAMHLEGVYGDAENPFLRPADDTPPDPCGLRGTGGQTRKEL